MVPSAPCIGLDETSGCTSFWSHSTASAFSMTRGWPMRLTTAKEMFRMKGAQKPSSSNMKLPRGGPMVRLNNAQGMNVGMNHCVPTLMKSLSWPGQAVLCRLEAGAPCYLGFWTHSQVVLLGPYHSYVSSIRYEYREAQCCTYSNAKAMVHAIARLYVVWSDDSRGARGHKPYTLYHLRKAQWPIRRCSHEHDL